MNKLCRLCGEEKPLSDFSKHLSAKDGYRNQCKKCENERYRGNKRQWAVLWRETHKDKIAHYRKERNKRVKIEVMEHYGGVRCSCCGESNFEFLCFDHVAGGGTQHRKIIGNMGRQFYYWLKLNGYPKGYRVLCYNCNMSLGFYGYCPHKREKYES